MTWTRVVLLTLVWVALTGDATLGDALFGSGVSWLVLRFVGERPAMALGWGRLPAALRLTAYFLWELVVANLKVAAVVLRPDRLLRPGIVAVPLDATSDAQITLLANLITLTPGTLSIDVSSDRRVLYVHFLQVDDPEAARRGIKEGFERRVLEVLA